MEASEKPVNGVVDQWSHQKDDGKRPDHDEDYVGISYEEGKHYPDHLHACHAVIWSANKDKAFDESDARGSVMMHVRFDGYFGFAGGIVDPGEDRETAINRELNEELGLDTSLFKVTPEHHLVSHLYETNKKKLCLHFYSLEVSQAEFNDIERNVLNSIHYGKEVFGSIRVPLFTLQDGMRGLPIFLCGNFAGNGRTQLLTAIKAAGLLSDEEIQKAKIAAEKFRSTNRR
ncbi:U8 snoRNA-decapping enzyme-like [Lineus longissimus]|uniref:U8 snoRNA-decapping enzyme-like n=1 Tax=Lineus longissimus TaxID=88925 RepID=UPI002B4C6CE8